jgi:hypothetical protein
MGKYCSIVVATVFFTSAFAQTSAVVQNKDEQCTADAALWIGKWDGFWSGIRADGVFDVLSVFPKDGKCVLKFKTYLKENEGDEKSLRFTTAYEATLEDDSSKDSFKRQVERVNTLWGTINKKENYIDMNHLRAGNSTAGFARFKKRV